MQEAIDKRRGSVVDAWWGTSFFRCMGGEEIKRNQRAGTKYRVITVSLTTYVMNFTAYVVHFRFPGSIFSFSPDSVETVHMPTCALIPAIATT